MRNEISIISMLIVNIRCPTIYRAEENKENYQQYFSKFIPLSLREICPVEVKELD
jgi:hypothetical protein